MPLSPGDKLGSYEILAPLGKGGMGEVYRARDTKLDREVAIKVMPSALAQDAERLARFEREAKVLASLNHPNIAQIYGIEESPAGRALVMELVPGNTLETPLKQDEALRIAAQIAEALEAAHEKGIIHRDLKPANIMITPQGVAKVLDFGLAAVPQKSADPNASDSPTLTMAATQAGVIMGTAAYMSPEQAAGQTVDKRADIWSFGVVLWEMLVGKRMFTGSTVAHILASVLQGPIDFDKVPSEMRGLVKRCLDRDVKTRLRDIGEARVAIAQYLSGTGIQPVEVAAKPSKLVWGVVGALLLSTLGLGVIAYRHTTEEPPQVVKLSLLPPEKGDFTDTSIPAISPDGRRLTFGATVAGKTAIWVRDLDAIAPRMLPGTEDGQYPFWSPDSRSVAFFSGSKLKKIDVAGGPATTVCEVQGGGRGGAWANDMMVFGTSGNGMGALFQVPASGGVATLWIKPDPAVGETLLRWPAFLPDGRHFFYSANNSDQEKGAIHIGDLPSKTHQRLMLAGSNAVYAGGHLLFVRDTTLLSQPFDEDKLQTTGEAVPIAEDVIRGLNSLQFQLSASRNGVLVFQAGQSRNGDVQLDWFDHSGKLLGTVGPAFNWGVLSPDGSAIAFDRRNQQATQPDIWVRNLARGTDSRFTFGSLNTRPVWSPDGSQIAFSKNSGGVAQGFVRAVAGGTDQPLGPLASGGGTVPVDWSRDGRYVLEEAGNDLWVQPLFGDKKPFAYLNSPFIERQGKFSPDGKWVAYASDESNRYEVYVQSFPTPGNRAQVSVVGGGKPVWSRDGKELYFISGDQKMMAVGVKTGAKFEAGTPKALFDTRIGPYNPNRFDVSKDGRFLIPVQVEQSGASPLTVVMNWTGLLKPRP